MKSKQPLARMIESAARRHCSTRERSSSRVRSFGVMRTPVHTMDTMFARRRRSRCALDGMDEFDARDGGSAALHDDDAAGKIGKARGIFRVSAGGKRGGIGGNHGVAR